MSTMNTTKTIKPAKPAVQAAEKPRRVGRPRLVTAEAPPLEATPTADRPPCQCGCGLVPAGAKARFRPGHDARFHAAQKKAAAAG